MIRYLVHSSTSSAKDKLESAQNRARLKCSMVSSAIPHPTTADLLFSVVVDDASFELFSEVEKADVYESFSELEALGFRNFLKTQETEPTQEEMTEVGANTYVLAEGVYYLYEV